MFVKQGVLCVVSVAVGVVLLVTLYAAVNNGHLDRSIPGEDNIETTPGTRATPSLHWDELFSFVPNGVRDCSKLFGGNGTIPRLFAEKLKEFQFELDKHQERREGYTAQYPHCYKAYTAMAVFPFVKTICETGFNAGHSTFGWLTVNPDVQVFSFDIGIHEYSRPMAAHLQTLYPGRLTVTWGDSTKTLPDFHRKHPDVTCDLIIIDGGHTSDVCKKDFYNFKKMANIENLVILDDYPTKWMMTELGTVWERGKRHGEVSEIFSCNYKGDGLPTEHGFAVGRYLQ